MDTVTLEASPDGVVLVVGSSRYDAETTERIRKTLLMHQLGEVLEPRWRDRRDESWTECEGTGASVLLLPGVTEAWCSVCCTRVPLVNFGRGLHYLPKHTRRVEARPA